MMVIPEVNEVNGNSVADDDEGEGEEEEKEPFVAPQEDAATGTPSSWKSTYNFAVVCILE